MSNLFELTQARAISELGTVIINSARVEIDYIDRIGDASSQFLMPKEQQTLGKPDNRVHRIK